MSHVAKTPSFNTGSGSDGADPRSLRLWNLLNQASEIIDDIEITLRNQREQARAAARAMADATTPRSVELINLIRDMHTAPNARAAVNATGFSARQLGSVN